MRHTHAKLDIEYLIDQLYEAREQVGHNNDQLLHHLDAAIVYIQTNCSHDILDAGDGKEVQENFCTICKWTGKKANSVVIANKTDVPY